VATTVSSPRFSRMVPSRTALRIVVGRSRHRPGSWYHCGAFNHTQARSENGYHPPNRAFRTPHRMASFRPGLLRRTPQTLASVAIGKVVRRLVLTSRLRPDRAATATATQRISFAFPFPFVVSLGLYANRRHSARLQRLNHCASAAGYPVAIISTVDDNQVLKIFWPPRLEPALSPPRAKRDRA